MTRKAYDLKHFFVISTVINIPLEIYISLQLLMVQYGEGMWKVSATVTPFYFYVTTGQTTGPPIIDAVEILNLIQWDIWNEKRVD